MLQRGQGVRWLRLDDLRYSIALDVSWQSLSEDFQRAHRDAWICHKCRSHAGRELCNVQVGNAQRYGVREQCRDAGITQCLGTQCKSLLRRQAVRFGDDGDGLVAAPWRGQDASDELVELIVIKQMGLLSHLRKWHDVSRNLEKEGKDLVSMYEGRIGLRQEPQQGGLVLFLDRLLLGIVSAPGSAKRRCLVLRGQAHPDGAGSPVSDCGVADLLEHAILNRTLLEQRDSRSAGKRSLLLQYRACRPRKGLGEVLVVATSSNVGFGITIFELERARDHFAHDAMHDSGAEVLSKKPDFERWISGHLAHDVDTSVSADDGRGVRYFAGRDPQRNMEPRPRKNEPGGY